MRLWQTEPWHFGFPFPWGCLPQAKPPGREGSCLYVCVCTCRRAHVRLSRQPVCSFPTAGGGNLPSSPPQSHYMQDQVCAVPVFCTAASAGSSGELSAFSYLPVWLTTQYMKLWSIELCYLKGWSFFPISFSVLVSVGRMFSRFLLFFYFFLFFCQKKYFLEENSPFLICLQALSYLRLRKSNWF